MRYLLYTILSGVVIFFCWSCSNPTGYDIQCTVKGLNNAEVYLAYYFGESTFICDTAKSDANGMFHFEGKEPLERGVYLVVHDNNKVFDLVIGDDQHFTLETSPDSYDTNMKVTGDKDNEIYFDYLRYDEEQRKKAAPAVAVLNDSTATEEKKKEAHTAFDAVRKEVLNYQKEVIQQNPSTMTATLFKSGQPLEAPDSTSNVKWYRRHFFDNFQLDDEALLRLPKPIYKEKIDEYLDNLFPPDPDTLIQAVDSLIAKAKGNEDTYKYATLICLFKYRTPEIMGLEKVFLHVVDAYILSGKMDYWANDQFKKNTKEMADRMRSNLIGMKAPNLIMMDANGKMQSLYDVNSRYVIMYFFDPDCGHCRIETPKLVSFYKSAKDKFDLQVYAVSVDSSMTKMRDYIKEMHMNWITVNALHTKTDHYRNLYDAETTPSVYILDDQKKIIARKIGVENIEEFLTEYEKRHPR